MTTISISSEVYTLINVFTVAAEHQTKLYEHLVDMTEGMIKNLPGFISANIHLSHDGAYVVNYAQWENEDSFRTMRADPRLQEHFSFCRSISIPKVIPCDVSYVSDDASKES